MMTNNTKENNVQLVFLTCVVKDYIHTQAWSGDPSYKWLDQSWSVIELMESIKDNNIHSKEDAIRHFLDIAHLFGKDRL